MLGQNTSAHFLEKSGADYLGGQITFLVGQNTWAPPKVGQITWDDFSCFPSSPSPAVQNYFGCGCISGNPSFGLQGEPDINSRGSPPTSDGRSTAGEGLDGKQE